MNHRCISTSFFPNVTLNTHTQKQLAVNCLLLHQRGKAATVGAAGGWSQRPDRLSELMCGGVDPAPLSLPGSLSPEGHEDGDEETEEEAVLLWVMQKCRFANQSTCDCPDSNSRPALLPAEK